jgi:hydrogenase maturation factor HypF (carbamoyltransferase family)
MKEEFVFKVYDLTGVVQGVGLRATIHWLANRAEIGGWVQNRTGIVRMQLEGDATTVATFVRDLPHHLPSGARIDTICEVRSGVLPSDTLPQPFHIASTGW